MNDPAHTTNSEHDESENDESLEQFGETFRENSSGIAAEDPEWELWITLTAEISVTKEPSARRSVDLVGKEFTSSDNAASFFRLFAKYTGFSVRKGVKRFRPGGETKSFTWLCASEGFRQRRFFEMDNRQKEPKPITRTGCKVRIRILENKITGLWEVRHFWTQHNHPVAISREARFLQSHRAVPGGTFQTAKAMHSAGIKTCHIISYLMDRDGGEGKSTFLRKDLRNKMDSATRELADSDASRAIGYLQHKSDYDLGLFAKYSVDASRRLLNIVWADSECQLDYVTFGQALAFDSTYRTNRYRKPLLVFVGVNNHFCTTVFGFAMLHDETVETYKWVLSAFFECMKGVKPQTVIIDGDHAMRRAIAEICPGAVHMLCSWLDRNAISNVKNPAFLTRLKQLMFRLYSVTEFEKEWAGMVDDLGLQNNSWVMNLYERRFHWAETYLRGNFFAGMTTTQRNEGINSFLKKKVQPAMPLHQWVRHLDMAVSWLRHTEQQDKFETNHGAPQLGVTNMPCVEKQASEIYTRRMFYKVRTEIVREGRYMVGCRVERENIVTFKLAKYGTTEVFRTVKYDRDARQFICQCAKFETVGIPCLHIFATMKAMQMTAMPSTLVHCHWTRTIKGILRYSTDAVPPYRGAGAVEASRFAELTSICSVIAWFSSRTEGLFNPAKKKLIEVKSIMRGLWENDGKDEVKESELQQPMPNVNNPDFAHTKGCGSSPSGKTRRKRCGFCRERGHNIQTCHKKRQVSPSTSFYQPSHNDATHPNNGDKNHDINNDIASPARTVEGDGEFNDGQNSGHASASQSLSLTPPSCAGIASDGLETGTEWWGTPYGQSQRNWWGSPYGG